VGVNVLFNFRSNEIRSVSVEDKFFDLEEAMVDYAEMTSFDFKSGKYLAVSDEQASLEEYAHQPFTFKYGNFDVVDMLKLMFSKPEAQVK
jgi:hypothetical protein